MLIRVLTWTWNRASEKFIYLSLNLAFTIFLILYLLTCGLVGKA